MTRADHTPLDLYAFDNLCEVVAIVKEVGDYIDENADLVEEVEYRQVAEDEWDESDRYAYLDYDHTEAVREFKALPEVTARQGRLDNHFLTVEVGEARARIDLTDKPQARIALDGERVARHCYASHDPADLDERVQGYCKHRAREFVQLPDFQDFDAEEHEEEVESVWQKHFDEYAREGGEADD